MRLLDYFLAGLALVSLPVVFWWSIYQAPWSAVNLVQRLDLQARLAMAAGGHDWARVAMDGQRAVLTGAAPSADLAREAAGLVLASSGPGGVIAGGVTVLRMDVSLADPVSPYLWRAEKKPGVGLVIEGFAPSSAIRNALAEEAARTSRLPVDDRTQLADGAPAGDYQGAARLALKAVSALEAGVVEFRDHEILLRGAAGAAHQRKEARAHMDRLLAPWRAQVIIEGDVRWRARLEPGRLTLTGHVSVPAERRQIVRTAAAAFQGEIIDQMVEAPDLPEGWANAVLAGLPGFLDFEAGEMAFDGSPGAGVTFSGVARASVLYFLRKEMQKSGQDWSLAVSVADPPVAAPGDLAQASDCAGEIGGLLGATPAPLSIRFDRPGSAFSPESAPALDELAARIRRCDRSKRFEIEASSLVEASELVDYLVLAGIEQGRLAAISAGRDGPDTVNHRMGSAGPGAGWPVIRVLERSGE